MRTRRHGSKETSVARRAHRPSNILEVRITFAPSRVSSAGVVQAYERVVPIPRRLTPHARSARPAESAPLTQHGGRRQDACL
jgi:hypothetical protein